MRVVSRESRVGKRLTAALWRSIVVLLLAGCEPDMGVQPKYESYGKNDFFEDGADMRPIPAHTVARGHADRNDAYHTGVTAAGTLIAEFPELVTPGLLIRGREQYDIYCAVCHGFTGAGNGMIVQRGFPPPPTFHSDRLRNAPPGHFVNVIRDGYGVMFSYGSRVQAPDRWAVAAYIRALQLSQHAALADAPPPERTNLKREAPP